MKNFEKIRNWVIDNLSGILAFIAGLILVAYTIKYMITLVFFAAGLFLIYFGLVKMNVKPVVKWINDIWRKIKISFNK